MLPTTVVAFLVCHRWDLNPVGLQVRNATIAVTKKGDRQSGQMLEFLIQLTHFHACFTYSSRIFLDCKFFKGAHTLRFANQNVRECVPAQPSSQTRLVRYTWVHTLVREPECIRTLMPKYVIFLLQKFPPPLDLWLNCEF